MSSLQRGDEKLHYSDNSHRWIAPPKVDQDEWNNRVRAHMDQHSVSRGPASVPRRIPGQRRPVDTTRSDER